VALPPPPPRRHIMYEEAARVGRLLRRPRSPRTRRSSSVVARSPRGSKKLAAPDAFPAQDVPQPATFRGAAGSRLKERRGPVGPWDR